MDATTSYGVPEEFFHRSSKCFYVFRSDCKPYYGDSEDNGSDLDLSDFESKYSSDNCDD